MKKLLLATLFCTSLMAQDIEYSASGGMTRERFKTLKERYGLKTFIETGTAGGHTTKKAAPFFDKVYTIELSHKYYQLAKAKLKKYSNILVLQGRSEIEMEKLLAREGAPSTLFFLDAHYSAGETAKAKNDPPVNEEFLVIEPHLQDNTVIILDDVRCFRCCATVVERDYYPLLKDLKNFINARYNGFGFYIIGDQAVIFNPTYYNEEISPGVDLLTKMYTTESKEEFLELARTISEVLTEKEKQAVYEMYKNKTACAMMRYFVGILEKDKGNYRASSIAFQLALKAGLKKEFIDAVR